MSDCCTRLIVLSVDYEIFGNGSGDARQHIIVPTDRMVRVCEKYRVPLTVFFEVEEYLAFSREQERLRDLLGYDPASEIRQQVLDLARRGHDFQLHIHPEWAGCSFKDGVWQLHPEKRTIDSLFDSPREVSDFIRERKAVIDDLLVEAGSAQRVCAYRAGAFCAQPSRKLLPALAENGITIDSSVVKGMHRHDEHVRLDFSTAPIPNRHWRVREDVAIEDSNGSVTEIPIYSQMGRRIHQMTPKRLLAKFSGQVPKDKQREMVEQLRIGKSPAAILRFLRQRFPIKLDFHNMSAGQMLRWIRSAPPAPPGELDIIVLIGHTKEHRDDADFERFLAGVAADPSLEVISMSEVARRLAAQREAVGVSAKR